MVLHRYLIRYTTHLCYQTAMATGEPFSVLDLEEMARRNKVLLEKEVKAFTAADALTQFRASEGFDGQQLPFVFFVDALPDAPPSGRERSKHSWENWTEKDVAQEVSPTPITLEDEARCACGAVAVQWRKDNPVCARHRNEDNDE